MSGTIRKHLPLEILEGRAILAKMKCTITILQNTIIFCISMIHYFLSAKNKHTNKKGKRKPEFYEGAEFFYNIRNEEDIWPQKVENYHLEQLVIQISDAIRTCTAETAAPTRV